MKTRSTATTAAVTAALVLGGALVAVVPVLGGLLGDSPFRSVGHPPCAELPDAPAVEAALTSHADLVSEVMEQGPGVAVEVARPCKQMPDAAIIEIRYHAGSTGLESIETALNRNEGFGVPVIVREH